MFRSLKIELKKLVKYPIFWIFLGIYFALVIFSSSMVERVLSGLEINGEQLSDMAIDLSIYSFPDIWHNLSYVAGLLPIKIFLAVFTILFICNEFSFKTLRAAIMNGMSRMNAVLGKWGFLKLLALSSTFLIFMLCLILGQMPEDGEYISRFANAEFLVAYFFEVLMFLSFAALFGYLFRNTGLAIIVFLFYQVFEFIIKFILPQNLRGFLPLKLNADLIRNPVYKNLPEEIIQNSPSFAPQLSVDWMMVGISIAYTAVFLIISYILVAKRDL